MLCAPIDNADVDSVAEPFTRLTVPSVVWAKQRAGTNKKSWRINHHFTTELLRYCDTKL